MPNGVKNPSGIFLAAFGPVYLAGAPVASAITAPNGIVQSLMETMVRFAVRGDVAPDRTIAALALIYAVWSYAGSATISVGGQAMSRSAGFDSDNPRQHRGGMEGLPLRLMSAHHSLLEVVPLFATAACLAQVLAPENQQIRNLLGLHVMLKTFVFYPSYVAGISSLRGLAHLLSISAIISVFWQLTKRSR